MVAGLTRLWIRGYGFADFSTGTNEVWTGTQVGAFIPHLFKCIDNNTILYSQHQQITRSASHRHLSLTFRMSIARTGYMLKLKCCAQQASSRRSIEMKLWNKALLVAKSIWKICYSESREHKQIWHSKPCEVWWLYNASILMSLWDNQITQKLECHVRAHCLHYWMCVAFNFLVVAL